VIHPVKVKRRESQGEGYVAIQAALLLSLAVAPSLERRHAARTPLKRAGTLLLLTGVAFGLWGGRSLGRNLTPLPVPKTGATLTESGAYRYARHPIYGGLLLAATGWSMRRQSVVALLLTAGLGALFMAKSRFEEVALTQRFAGYPAYRRRVHRFIPGVW
jgi:protein-S-isoprenylcysteine O-methyltransferase Ste14